MSVNEGRNAQDMKYFNRLNVLRIIATEGPISRSDIVSKTGITKMSVSNITSDLIRAGYISEKLSDMCAEGHSGRNPLMLRLSDNSPCVLGIYIGRRYSVVQICDLSSAVIVETVYDYGEFLTAELLIDAICTMFDQLRSTCQRTLVCAGISAMGPVDTSRGLILTPPQFFNISNVPIVEILETRLGIPCKLFHDASAAALAEALYGSGKSLDDFIFIIIQNGIGAGVVINGKLIDGKAGLGGELGHSSINSDGPKCICGNRGCLELYANEYNLYHDYLHFGGIGVPPNMRHILAYIIEKAQSSSEPAIHALDHFAEYLSAAIGNLINIISTENIILGYRGENFGLLEEMIEKKTASRIVANKDRILSVTHSAFHHKGPVIGAIALAVQQIFDGYVQLDLCPADSENN